MVGATQSGGNGAVSSFAQVVADHSLLGPDVDPAVYEPDRRPTPQAEPRPAELRVLLRCRFDEIERIAADQDELAIGNDGRRELEGTDVLVPADLA